MTSPKVLDPYLQKANQFITLGQKDREIYTNHYDRIKMYLITEMKAKDELFRTSFNGIQLSGSYADNLRVTTPNEFDTIFKIKFPVDYSRIRVTEAPERPAYVQINLSNCDQTQLGKFKSEKIIDEEGYVLQNKLQAWIERVLTKVTIGLVRQNSRFVINNGGYTYLLSYSKQGPAHTFDVMVQNTSVKFSMDMVPSIQLDEKHWIAKRTYNDATGHTNWLAVAKPDKQLASQRSSSNRAFISSYTLHEDYFIGNRNSLKNVIRLFKKMRDTNGLTNLKSYYIKTIFLWKSDLINKTMTSSEAIKYWNRSLGELFMTMFNDLLEALSSKTLRFFWIEKYNMFGNYNDWQLKSLHDQLYKIKQNIEKALSEGRPEFILTVVLNSTERQSLDRGSKSPPISPVPVIKNTTSTSHVAEESSSWRYGAVAINVGVAGAVAAFGIYKLFQYFKDSSSQTSNESRNERSGSSSSQIQRPHL